MLRRTKFPRRKPNLLLTRIACEVDPAVLLGAGWWPLALIATKHNLAMSDLAEFLRPELESRNVDPHMSCDDCVLPIWVEGNVPELQPSNVFRFSISSPAFQYVVRGDAEDPFAGIQY